MRRIIVIGEFWRWFGGIKSRIGVEVESVGLGVSLGMDMGMDDTGTGVHELCRVDGFSDGRMWRMTSAGKWDIGMSMDELKNRRTGWIMYPGARRV